MKRLPSIAFVIPLVFIVIIFACSRSVLPDGKEKNTSDKDLGDLLPADTMYIGRFFKVEEFDGSSTSIFERKIVRAPYMNLMLEHGVKGKVAALVCIEKKGNVVFAQIVNSECTVRNRKTLRSLLMLISNLWFQKTWNAPSHQCGRLNFYVENENFIKSSDGYIIEYGELLPEEGLTIGTLSDSIHTYDSTGAGVFGRKIIYRDLSATRAAVTTSGKVATKVCINRDGLVTYVELINAETTIRDKFTLRAYLKAARGYKFQPDLTAPKEQCGKLSFVINSNVRGGLR